MNRPETPFAPASVEDLAEQGTEPIPAEYYYKPEHFAAEREAIFRRTWLMVGHVSELAEPGRFIVREIEAAPASVLIVRGTDGTLRAFHNVCTHRGTRLVAEESGQARRFSCRYHMWTYGEEGQLLAMPEEERFFVDKAACGLKKVAIDQCGGLIFINLAHEPETDLRTFLGPLTGMIEAMPVARATTFHEYAYEIAANWKVCYDNFQENYHIRFIHPRSIGNSTLAPENPYGYATDYEFHGPHRVQNLWSNAAFVPQPVQGTSGTFLVRKAIEDGYGDTIRSAPYLGVFPNTFVMGSSVLHFIHTVWPISAERSRGVIRVMWHGNDSSATERFAREFTMAAARDIHSEDMAIIEEGQRGISTGAIDHVHFQTQEVMLRHFINAVRDAIDRHRATLGAGGAA